MRHSIYGKKLGRNKNQRTALFRALVGSLILSESIQTTQAKAQAIKGTVDKIITQAKNPTTQRFVAQFLTNKKVSDKLMNDLLPRLQDRNSGYTSVVKLGRRLGDGAMLVQMSLLAAPASNKGKAETGKKSEKEVLEATVTTKAAKPAKETNEKTEAKGGKKTVSKTKGK